MKFLTTYHNDKYVSDFEKYAIDFITNYDNYNEFIEVNIGRDCFLGVESVRFLYLKSIYNTTEFLCSYLNISWEIDSIAKYVTKSQEIFGKDYNLYEQQMEEVLEKLKINKLIQVLESLKKIICEIEKDYWLVRNNSLYNLMFNIENGKLPYL